MGNLANSRANYSPIDAVHRIAGAYIDGDLDAVDEIFYSHIDDPLFDQALTTRSNLPTELRIPQDAAAFLKHLVELGARGHVSGTEGRERTITLFSIPLSSFDDGIDNFVSNPAKMAALAASFHKSGMAREGETVLLSRADAGIVEATGILPGKAHAILREFAAGLTQGYAAGVADPSTESRIRSMFPKTNGEPRGRSSLLEFDQRMLLCAFVSSEEELNMPPDWLTGSLEPEAERIERWESLVDEITGEDVLASAPCMITSAVAEMSYQRIRGILTGEANALGLNSSSRFDEIETWTSSGNVYFEAHHAGHTLGPAYVPLSSALLDQRWLGTKIADIADELKVRTSKARVGGPKQ